MFVFINYLVFITMALLNLQNIPGKQLSGLDNELIDFITNESNERYLHELSKDFSEEVNNINNIFPEISLTEDEILELENLENSSIPFGTDQQTKRHTQMFKTFLEEKKLCPDFQKVPNSILNDYLRLFYSTLKTKMGDLYAPSSLICIRASIQRYLTSPQINRTINIVHGDDFRRANGVLKAMIGAYLRSGQRKSKSYEAISPNDMDKLSSYFDRSSNKKIQEEVLFNVIYFFGLRGRENLRDLKRSTFACKTDENGNEYIGIEGTMISKNVKASFSKKEYSESKCTRMYEVQNKLKCPVEVFKLYASLLPETTQNNTLFPKCIKNGFSSIAVTGKDSFGNFLSTISEKAGLKKRYTNHCLRVTTVTVLKEQGYSNEEVASVTGHKNVASVQKYSRNRTDKRIHKMSNALYYANEDNQRCESSPAKRFSLGDTQNISTTSDLSNSNESRSLSNSDVGIGASLTSQVSVDSLRSLFGSNNKIEIGTLNIYMK